MQRIQRNKTHSLNIHNYNQINPRAYDFKCTVSTSCAVFQPDADDSEGVTSEGERPLRFSPH